VVVKQIVTNHMKINGKSTKAQKNLDLYIYKSATMQIKSALYPGLTVVIIMQNCVKQFLLCPIIWIQKVKSLY